MIGKWWGNAVKLRTFPPSPPFAKGDLGGFSIRYNKSPPTPLYKGGRTALNLTALSGGVEVTKSEPKGA